MVLFIIIWLAVCIFLGYVCAKDFHTHDRRRQKARAVYYIPQPVDHDYYRNLYENNKQQIEMPDLTTYLPHGTHQQSQAVYSNPEHCPDCCDDNYCTQHNHLFLADAEDDAYQYWYGESDRQESGSSDNFLGDWHFAEHNDSSNDGGFDDWCYADSSDSSNDSNSNDSFF